MGPVDADEGAAQVVASDLAVAPSGVLGRSISHTADAKRSSSEVPARWDTSGPLVEP
jgi:hypothetical protein